MTAWIDQTTAYWRAGGPLLVLLALTCFGIVGGYLRSRERLTRVLREAEGLAQRWKDAGVSGGYDALLSDLASRDGSVAAMWRRAMEDIRRGDDAVTALRLRETECLRVLQHDFMVLAGLTTAAPLLGLLGTVMGMMTTFDAVSAVPALSTNPGEWMAAGISRALITTQFGLVVALPGAFGLARLRRLLRHIETRLSACRILAVKALTGKQAERDGS